LVAVLLFMICVGFALKVSADFSRGTILLLAIVGPALFCMSAIFWRAISRTRLNTANYGRRRVLVIAEDTGLERVTQLLHRSGRSLIDF